MTKLHLVLSSLFLISCDSSVHGFGKSNDAPLWETVSIDAGTPWSEENILYDENYFWPTLPLTEGSWCRMEVLYWIYGVESAFYKDALVLDKINNEWNLWIYSHSWPLGNDFVPGVEYESTGKIHCIVKDKIHTIKEPENRQFRFDYILFLNHYDGICQKISTGEGSSWDTPPQECMINIQAFQGQVIVSLGKSIEKLTEEHESGETDEDSYRDTIIGTYQAMNRDFCPPFGPIVGDMDEKARVRIEKWADSFIGQDAPLGETVTMAKARAQKIWRENGEL